MISNFIVLVGLAASVAFAHGGITPTLPGACPDFKPMDNFDTSKATGVFYEHFHGKAGIDAEFDEKCEKLTVTPKPDGTSEVEKTYLDGEGKEHRKKVTSTKLEGTQAKFAITSDDIKEKGLTVTHNILDTDYTNYWTAIDCFSDGSKHGYIIQICGRGKTLAAADAVKAKDALKSRDIDVELTPVDQSC